jgi:hypothetical protein
MSRTGGTTTPPPGYAFVVNWVGLKITTCAIPKSYCNCAQLTRFSGPAALLVSGQPIHGLEKEDIAGFTDVRHGYSDTLARTTPQHWVYF